MPEGTGFDDYLNLASVVTLEHCKVEPSLAGIPASLIQSGVSSILFVALGLSIDKANYKSKLSGGL